MTAKDVIKAINLYAHETGNPQIEFRYMSKTDWGIAKRIGLLFNSKLHLNKITLDVANTGGFKYGYFTPYSYTIYKKSIEKIGDLSYERPANTAKGTNRKT